jgi:preprotein translocase subunit SecA
LSLEDPVMRQFAGDRIDGTLKQLGMSQSETISGWAVSRAVKSAQTKIQNHATGDHAADSAHEWFQYNYPDVSSLTQDTF